MTVTLRVIENGKKIEDQIFAGKYMKHVVDYLNENQVSFETELDSGDAIEISKNEGTKLILLDDTNLLSVEGTANFITEYTIEYNEDIYRGIVSVLNL